MKRKSTVGVLLKGGLGNQLFQIAAGLHSSRGKSLEVFGDFTLPRKTAGVPDSLYFNWPQQVIVSTATSNKLEKKVLALSLKLALDTRVSKGKYIFNQLVKVLTNSLFTFHFREKTNIISGEGVGYCPIEIRPGRNLLNGYFQAHQFPFNAEVYSQMRGINLKEISPTLNQWINKARIENPIIVHLRLGDYKQESGIGVISPNYYKSALEKI